MNNLLHLNGWQKKPWRAGDVCSARSKNKNKTQEQAEGNIAGFEEELNFAKPEATFPYKLRHK